MDDEQRQRITSGRGFFAALDQSGGSTPKALAEYGIGEDAWSTDAEMFDLMHRMRSRVVTSPAFGGDRVLGAILFEQTMHREVDGQLTGDFLWEQKRVVPFVKIDKGLEDESDGVQRMKPIAGLDQTLEAARDLGMFGTKMRSVIKHADETGVAAIVDQQVEVAAQVASYGLVPILEPEVDIRSDTKREAEQLLLDRSLERLADVDFPVLFKVSIPTVPDHYAPLVAHPHVLRVVALSGGYERDEACRLLARCPDLIASFSRALLQGLTAQQTAAEFDATLDAAVAAIHAASVEKQIS